MACEDLAREALDAVLNAEFRLEVGDRYSVSMSDANAMVGKARRAKADDAIGSGVKANEAASDAEIGRDFLDAIEAARSQYPWLADWTPAERYGELIGDLLDIAFPMRSASSDIVRDVVRKAILFSDWAAGEGICSSNPHIADPDDFMSRLYVTGDETPDAIADAALAALSTHTAAGAGPVGEGTRAWALDTIKMVYQDMIVGSSPRDHLEAAYRALAARPVEEPGEVERLTRERDEALTEGRSLRGQVQLKTDKLDAANERRHQAEAALAETRECLEKYRVALQAIEICAETSPKDAVAVARAALTGDAQEAGR